MLKVFDSLMWVIGAVISYAGMQVYITWGTVIKLLSESFPIVLDMDVRLYQRTEEKRTTSNTSSRDPSTS